MPKWKGNEVDWYRKLIQHMTVFIIFCIVAEKS